MKLFFVLNVKNYCSKVKKSWYLVSSYWEFVVCWSPWWLWCILEITDDSCQLIQEVLNPHTNTQISIEWWSALWAEQVTAQNLLVYISFTPISYVTWRITLPKLLADVWPTQFGRDRKYKNWNGMVWLEDVEILKFK